MDADKLVSFISRAMVIHEQVMASPLGPSIRAFAFLFGMSGAFWSVSRLCGWFALKIHDALHEDFAALFALTYNVVLASLFGGVMAFAAYRKAAESPFLVAYQAAGFILVYIVLSAAYANERGAVDPHSGGGYAGGIAAYLLFCLFPRWLSGHPLLVDADEVVAWVVTSPAGKIMVAASVINGLLYAVRTVRAWFFWKSVKIGKRRFFFSFAY